MISSSPRLQIGAGQLGPLDLLLFRHGPPRGLRALSCPPEQAADLHDRIRGLRLGRSFGPARAAVERGHPLAATAALKVHWAPQISTLPSASVWMPDRANPCSCIRIQTLTIAGLPTNGVAAGRLYRVAQALGVDVGYFFEEVESESRFVPSTQQRMLLDLTRNYVNIPIRKHQEAIVALARVLAEAANGDVPAPRDPGHKPLQGSSW